MILISKLLNSLLITSIVFLSCNGDDSTSQSLLNNSFEDCNLFYSINSEKFLGLSESMPDANGLTLKLRNDSIFCQLIKLDNNGTTLIGNEIALIL